MESATVGRRGPIEGDHVIGVDASMGSRPGVPSHAQPSPESPDASVSRQATAGEKLTRSALDEPTPVFGSAQPPRGISGVLRRSAYSVPEHYARHWMLLLLADRIDVVEDRLGQALARPLEARGADRAAERIRANPAPVLAAGLLGLVVAKKLLS